MFLIIKRLNLNVCACACVCASRGLNSLTDLDGRQKSGYNVATSLRKNLKVGKRKSINGLFLFFDCWYNYGLLKGVIVSYQNNRISSNKIDKKYVSVSSAKNSQKKRDIPILFDNFDSRVDSEQKITQADLNSKVFSVLTIASVFFILLYVYFSFVKKKSKLKKHII